MSSLGNVFEDQKSSSLNKKTDIVQPTVDEKEKILKRIANKIKLPAPQNVTATYTGTAVQVSWDLVPEAIFYNIYQSVVPVGDPPGEFTYVTVSSSSPYNIAAQAGMRQYVYVIATNDTQTSEPSDTAYVDVVD